MTFVQTASTPATYSRPNLFEKLRQAISDKWNYRKTCKELHNLSDHQLLDLGISRDQISNIVEDILRRD